MFPSFCLFLCRFQLVSVPDVDFNKCLISCPLFLIFFLSLCPVCRTYNIRNCPVDLGVYTHIHLHTLPAALPLPPLAGLLSPSYRPPAALLGCGPGRCLTGRQRAGGPGGEEGVGRGEAAPSPARSHLQVGSQSVGARELRGEEAPRYWDHMLLPTVYRPNH